MKKVITDIIVLSLLLACGDIEESGECETSSAHYSHSVLYCEGEPPMVYYACDDSGEEERMKCVYEREMETETCKSVSICCVEYNCSRGE